MCDKDRNELRQHPTYENLCPPLLLSREDFARNHGPELGKKLYHTGLSCAHMTFDKVLPPGDYMRLQEYRAQVAAVGLKQQRRGDFHLEHRSYVVNLTQEPEFFKIASDGCVPALLRLVALAASHGATGGQ